MMTEKETPKRKTTRQKKKLNIRPEVIKDTRLTNPTYEDVKARYGLPETLGNPPKKTQQAMDACMRAPINLLTHTIGTMGPEMFPQFLGYSYLVGISQNPWIRAGVEMIADEMTGRFIELEYSGDGIGNEDNNGDDKVAELTKDLERFHIRDKLREAVCMDGYYGGCLLYIDTGVSEPLEMLLPLALGDKTFMPGSLRGFKVVEPFNVSPGLYNSTNPLAESYYRPKTWFILGQEIHESRFCVFRMNEVGSLLLPAYNFFGIPLSQTVLDSVTHFVDCKEAEARLITKFSDIVVKTDMSDILSGGSSEALDLRMQYFVQNRSNDGVQVIDKETEDVVGITTPLAGVTDIVRQSMEMVSACFNEPTVKMWGISPSGFNASDNADMQNHYDHIASQQEKLLRSQLEKILKVLQLNRYGVIDENITFRFKKLDDDDEAQLATTNKTKAETATLYVNMGAISPDEARERLSKDKQSGYNNLPMDEVLDDGEQETLPNYEQQQANETTQAFNIAANTSERRNTSGIQQSNERIYSQNAPDVSQ